MLKFDLINEIIKPYSVFFLIELKIEHVLLVRINERTKICFHQ